MEWVAESATVCPYCSEDGSVTIKSWLQRQALQTLQLALLKYWLYKVGLAIPWNRMRLLCLDGTLLHR